MVPYVYVYANKKKQHYFALTQGRWENWAIVHLASDNWLSWIICFIGIDFGYYVCTILEHHACCRLSDNCYSLQWFHRLGHELNSMWASHSAHHSSDEYNLTTAVCVAA